MKKHKIKFHKVDEGEWQVLGTDDLGADIQLGNIAIFSAENNPDRLMFKPNTTMVWDWQTLQTIATFLKKHE